MSESQEFTYKCNGCGGLLRFAKPREQCGYPIGWKLRCSDCEMAAIKECIKALDAIGRGPFGGPDYYANSAALGYCGPGMK